uniref:Fibronectin type-III domain-containing protein 3A-like isoform X1 n=1 Tax=Hirondellea gigas TaxID=1518452 RepID=A0A6A7G3P9_9CRUS
MLTTTMVAVPGPTCYPDMMHHQQLPPPQPLVALPQQQQSLPPQSMPQQTLVHPAQPAPPLQPQTHQQQQQQQNLPNQTGAASQQQQPPPPPSNSGGPPPPQSSQPANTSSNLAACNNHTSVPPPTIQHSPAHPSLQQHAPGGRPLLHQHPPPPLTVPVPLNHTSLGNTTLTNSTNIPVVTSTIDMAAPIHQYNPNQPPPPYCPPEYYGGEYYPGPPPDYCPPTHMCAVHGVPQGPATVRMVSTNSNPPIALPVQVPPGHVVQQIVDENGTLQHVILSSQFGHMSVCYHGGNGGQPGPPQFYGQPGNPPPTHQGYVTSYQPSPPQYSPVMTPPPLTQPSPPPHNYQQKPDRHIGRQFEKPRHKIYPRQQQQQQQQHYGGPQQSIPPSNASLANTPPLSPKKEDGYRKAENGGEDEAFEDIQAQLAALLSQIPPVQIKNITPRSATLHWKAPPLHLLHQNNNSVSSAVTATDDTDSQQDNLNNSDNTSANSTNNNCNHQHQRHVPLPTEAAATVSYSTDEVSYEVLLNGALITTVNGHTNTLLHDLKPGFEYSVQIWCLCGSVRGSTASVELVFYTPSTVPEKPGPPRLINKTKNNLHIKWVSPRDDGGARITGHVLELMESTGCAADCSNNGAATDDGYTRATGAAHQWREVYRGRGREFTVNKLTPATGYRLRIAAVNQNGPSDWSPELVCTTCGVPPSQPHVPSLERAAVNGLTLAWPRNCPTESYILKMEDSLNGYGFMPVYRGPENVYSCTGLRRNSDYKFRLAAENDNGESPLSDIVCYSTQPEKPGAPTPPSVKGKPRTHYLRLCWSPPSDHGGSCIARYRLTMDKGQGFEVVYVGEHCECDCHELVPGTCYQVKAQAISAGGDGPWSKVNTVTTEPIAPHQCRPPAVSGKPKANLMNLKWECTPCDGGSAVTEYNLEMISSNYDRRMVYTGRNNECTVASLLPGRAYIFLVRAVNRVGPGQWSEPLESVSGAGPPDAPKCPQLSCRSPQTVTASWEAPINNGAKIDSYTIAVAEASLSHPELSESSSMCGDSEITELIFNTATTTSSTTGDVRHLHPDTSYAIRVCAVNSAGMGAFSSHALITTPSSVPSAPTHISTVTTSSSITLEWTEPKCNGDPIQHYVVELVDTGVSRTTIGPMLEFTMPDCEPDTSYRVRVRACNSVGQGSYSTAVKCQTRSLPPAPPVLELVKASYNSFKLSWGDRKQNIYAAQPLTYCLQMEYPNPHNNNKEFYQVYKGTNSAYKITKLDEATDYRLRICASNQAGIGPNSDPVHLRTTRAPPPAPKAPRARERNSENSMACFLVEWSPVRCFNDDPVTYVLQTKIATSKNDYTTVYTGSSTSHVLRQLMSDSLYNVRVCGVRHCGQEELLGGYSSPIVFNTPKVHHAPRQHAHHHHSDTAVTQRGTGSTKFSWRKLSDAKKASVIVIVFSLLAALLAYILAPTLGG